MSFSRALVVAHPRVFDRTFSTRLHVPLLFVPLRHVVLQLAALRDAARAVSLLASPRGEGIEAGGLGGGPHPRDELLHRDEVDVLVFGEDVVHEVEEDFCLVAVVEPVDVEVQAERSSGERRH